MRKNYKKMDEIARDIETNGLDEYVEFDNVGRYEFYKCGSCDGPILGHLQNKCRSKDPYEEQTIKSFEKDLRRVSELKKHVSDMKLAIAERGTRDRNPAPANPTTQLVKSRWPPGWSGQKFDKWRTEIEKWRQNNKSTEEDKYMDLIESLKKKTTQ